MPENVAAVLLRYSDFQTGVTVFVPACALPKCVRKTFSSDIRMDTVLIYRVWELPEKFCIPHTVGRLLSKACRAPDWVVQSP